MTAGDTTFEGGGAYLLDLRSDGTGAAGTDWDSLAVNGTLDISALSEANPFIVRLQTLDANNSLNYLEAWDRNVSHTWSSVLTSVALSGGDFDPRLFEVDTTDFKNPISGTFSVVQEGTNLNLQYDAAPSTLPGDYNQNGTVDAADYVVWRNGLGTTYTQTDYDVWRANFGTTAGSGSGATAGSRHSACRRARASYLGNDARCALSVGMEDCRAPQNMRCCSRIPLVAVSPTSHVDVPSTCDLLSHLGRSASALTRFGESRPGRLVRRQQLVRGRAGLQDDAYIPQGWPWFVDGAVAKH